MTHRDVPNLYMQVQVYESSGGLGKAPIVLPIVGFFAAIGLGLAGGYFNAYCPWVSILTLVAALACGGLLDAVIGVAARLSHCRIVARRRSSRGWRS